MTLEQVVALFPGGRWRKPGKYEARCPVAGHEHGDQKPSLGISQGRDGRIVFYCQIGHDWRDVIAAVGLQPSDVAPNGASLNGSSPNGARPWVEPVAVYRYDDEQGRPLFEKVRNPPGVEPRFWQRRPGARKGGIDGVRRVLYRLPDMLATQPGQVIAIVEGEKDADNLTRRGVVATTNYEGAARPDQKAKWQQEYTDWLRANVPDRRFLIFPDNDPTGYAHAGFVLQSLLESGLDARMVMLDGLEEKEDISDWLSRHDDDDLHALLRGPSVISVVGEKDPLVVSVLGRNGREPLKNGGFPEELAEEAYHGVPGMVMRILAPHTESHPAGILGAFLTAGGCLLGPRPHVYRDGYRHAANEFALLIGSTGSGRKGTASRRVDEIFMALSDPEKALFTPLTTDTTYDRYDQSPGNGDDRNDRRQNDDLNDQSQPEDWWKALILRGLGSGEALVAALAEENDRGERDPRKLVFETEFARCLKVMSREGSTLSDMLKNAWDGEPMHVRTKAHVLRADSSHVSIMGHCTVEEVRERLDRVELFNGFANRFMWLFTRRVRSLPFGGGRPPVAPIIAAMQSALLEARRRLAMEFDPEAAALWDQGGIYERLNEGAPGLLGVVTQRAAAHVTRIALQYALWDGAAAVGVPHLLAGLAVWDYSERTCAALFGRSTGEAAADTILERLAEIYPGWLSRKEIRDLFGRNAPPGRIPAALALLEQRGLARTRKVETGGHPAEVWCLTETGASGGIEGKSALEMAREQTGLKS